MEIRNATLAELDALIQIEQICFPPLEAASSKQITERFQVFPEKFIVALDQGRTIGFINGCVTDEPKLPDSLYHDTALHKPEGSYQTVFGLNVLPDYRRRGIASQLVESFIALAQSTEKKGVILTCKDHLIPFYSQLGFKCQGVSESSHGGSKWNDMLLLFE